MRYDKLLAVSLLVCGCASTAPQPSAPSALEGVEITLDHRGSLLDPGQLRFLESGESDQSIGHGEDFWLRLSNRSPFTISFATQSAYMSQPLEPLPTGPTEVSFAVADGAYLVIRFKGYDGPYGFGDMSWTSGVAVFDAGLGGLALGGPSSRRFVRRSRRASSTVPWRHCLAAPSAATSSGWLWSSRRTRERWML